MGAVQIAPLELQQQERINIPAPTIGSTTNTLTMVFIFGDIRAARVSCFLSFFVCVREVWTGANFRRKLELFLHLWPELKK